MEIKKVINNVKAVVAGAGTVVAETFDRLFDDNHDLVRLQKQNEMLMEQLKGFASDYEDLFEKFKEALDINSNWKKKAEDLENQLNTANAVLARTKESLERACFKYKILDAEKKELEEQNKALEQRNNALTSTVDQLDSYRLKHELLLERVNSEIDQCQSLSEEIRSKNVELAELKDELDLEAHHVSCLEDEIRELKRVIKDYARLYGPHRGYDPDAF